MLVDFRASMGSLIDGPPLGTTTCVPHVSVLQCPFHPAAVTGAMLDRIISITSREVGLFTSEAQLGDVYVQPVGWVFAETRFPEGIRHLQDRALSLMIDYIDTDAIDPNYDYRGHTAAEIANHRRFGYRYIGAQYRPHITLGRCWESDLPAGVQAAYRRDLLGTSVTFDRIAFYRAGESGTVVEVLAQRSWPPAP